MSAWKIYGKFTYTHTHGAHRNSRLGSTNSRNIFFCFHLLVGRLIVIIIISAQHHPSYILRFSVWIISSNSKWMHFAWSHYRCVAIYPYRSWNWSCISLRQRFHLRSSTFSRVPMFTSRRFPLFSRAEQKSPQSGEKNFRENPLSMCN